MKEPIALQGIAWDHSRAFPPLVAVAQRYEELHPGVRIRWEKRSLHEFGHMPIDQLTERFDLIVIDHPWAGFCFSRDLVHDCRQFISAEEFQELSGQFVGPAFGSYLYDGKLLALPIDAATPAPSWRPDLMEKHDLQPPQSWKDLLVMADRRQLLMPAFPADLFLNWCMLLEALKARAFCSPDTLADHGPAGEAMDLLKRLAEKMPPEIYGANPIRIAEWMTRSDDVACCAFAYSYSNYCRPSFTPKTLRYGPLPALADGVPLRSIVGGTGLALSRRCDHPETAMDFIRYGTSGTVQQGLYTYAGGQPAHRDAWNPENEERAFTGGFFGDARLPHQEAVVRPRYAGYVPLQEEAGIFLQRYFQGEISSRRALECIDAAYRSSLEL